MNRPISQQLATLWSGLLGTLGSHSLCSEDCAGNGPTRLPLEGGGRVSRERTVCLADPKVILEHFLADGGQVAGNSFQVPHLGGGRFDEVYKVSSAPGEN